MPSETGGDDEFLVCPNCDTLNHPNMIVCISCGVRLDTYQAVNQRYQTHRNEDVENRLDLLKTETEQSVQQEVQLGQRTFQRGLIILAVMFAGLVILVWGAAAIISSYQRAKLAELAAIYTEGTDCLKLEDWLCARNAFEKLSQKDPAYRDTLDLLIKAQTNLSDQYLKNGQTSLALQGLEAAEQLKKGDPTLLNRIFDVHRILANQYAAGGRWEDSLNELDLALQIRPGDALALDQMKALYDRWYQETLSSRNFLKAWLIRAQRYNRFPNP
jgi:tetratricopeptide (TPR) repeat protein